jgi:hypothetical protein
MGRCRFCFSGGVGDCWCFCSFFICTMIAPVDLLTSPDSFRSVVNCRQSSVVLYGNLPILRLQIACSWPMRGVSAAVLRRLVLSQPSAGVSRSTPDKRVRTLSLASTSSLARVSHFSPSRRHILACAALCDREAARLGRLPYLPAIHDCCCCKKAQHPREQHKAKESGAFACRRH